MNLKKILNNDLIISLIVVVVVVCMAIIFASFNNQVIPLFPNAHFHYLPRTSNSLSFLSNWDGPNYLNIVNHGYNSVKMANFFPLYPLVVYVVKQVLGSALNSALIVSWLSLVGAVYFYLKVIEKIFNNTKIENKFKAISFFILFPSGVFLIATYTEPLFSLFLFSAIYFALNKKYLMSGLLTMLATATHITGLFLIILVFFILLEQKVNLLKALIAAVIGGLGIASYMVFLQTKYHNFLEFLKTQHQIHGWLYYSFSNLLHSMDFFNVVFVVLLIITIYYWWSRRKSFAIYSFLFLLIPTLGGQFGGFNRYVLIAFPLQFMAYDFFKEHSKYYPYIMALMGICWTLFLLEYAGGYIGG
jgi:Gpi18-like mannosyltransferase